MIEANENFRMMLCHDGINLVVVHVPPKTLDLYRAGIVLPHQDSLNDDINLQNVEINSEDQLQQPQAPTLNLLAKNACLIQIGDWHWSTTTVCAAWLRGPMRLAAREFADKSKPFCLQIGKLTHSGVNLPHNIYSSKFTALFFTYCLLVFYNLFLSFFYFLISPLFFKCCFPFFLFLF